MTLNENNTLQFVEAFRSIRAAKNLFALLVLLAVLTQIAGFVLVDFVGVVDATNGQDPSQGVVDADAGQVESAATWYNILFFVLPAGKFFGFVLTILLALTLLIALKVGLAGRMDGAAMLVSAFFWSLVLLAVLTPWQQVLRSAYASGATFNFGELQKAGAEIKPAWGGEGGSTMDWILYYARFLAYPIIAVLLWICVQLKFARAYKAAVQGDTESRPEAPEVEPMMVQQDEEEQE